MLSAWPNAGDIILIAGKGHENYQIIGKEVLDFDDKIVAEQAVKMKINLHTKEIQRR